MSNSTEISTIDEKARILPLYVNSTGEDLWEPNLQIFKNTIHYVLVTCFDGSFYIENEKHTSILDKNHGMILIKDIDYQYYTKSDGCRIKYITFDGSGVPQILSYIGLDNSKAFYIDLSRFDADFHTIQLNMKTNSGYRASVGFQQILNEIFSAVSTGKSSKNIDLLNRYILENYCSNLDIQLLADIYGTSTSYLCREFKNKYGTSPMAYVNHLRIEKARYELTHTRKKILEIAQLCGFINTEYFCSVFKKYEHCTPLQYRRSHTTLVDETAL